MIGGTVHVKGRTSDVEMIDVAVVDVVERREIPKYIPAGMPGEESKIIVSPGQAAKILNLSVRK